MVRRLAIVFLGIAVCLGTAGPALASAKEPAAQGPYHGQQQNHQQVRNQQVPPVLAGSLAGLTPGERGRLLAAFGPRARVAAANADGEACETDLTLGGETKSVGTWILTVGFGQLLKQLLNISISEITSGVPVGRIISTIQCWNDLNRFGTGPNLTPTYPNGTPCFLLNGQSGTTQNGQCVVPPPNPPSNNGGSGNNGGTPVSGPGNTFCSGGTAVLSNGVCVGLPAGAYCEAPSAGGPNVPGVIRNGVCDTVGTAI